MVDTVGRLSAALTSPFQSAPAAPVFQLPQQPALAFAAIQNRGLLRQDTVSFSALAKGITKAMASPTRFGNATGGIQLPQNLQAKLGYEIQGVNSDNRYGLMPDILEVGPNIAQEFHNAHYTDKIRPNLEHGRLQAHVENGQLPDPQLTRAQITSIFTKSGMLPLAQKLSEQIIGFPNIRPDIHPPLIDSGEAVLDLKEENPVLAAYTSYNIALQGDAGIATTVMASMLLGGMPIWYLGTTDQIKKYLYPLVQGKTMAGLALSENNILASNPGATEATVEDTGDTYRFTKGEKYWITNLNLADFVVVIARDDQDNSKLSAYIVEKSELEKITHDVGNKLGLHTSDTGYADFKGLEIPKDGRKLGVAGDGTNIYLNILSDGRFNVALAATALAFRNLEKARLYAKERSVADFQQTAMKLADDAALTQTAFLLGLHAARLKGQLDEAFAKLEHAGTPYKDLEEKDPQKKAVSKLKTTFYQTAAAAKLFSTSIASKKTIDDALQIHGALGYMESTGIARDLTDARVTEIYEGTNEIQKNIIFGNLFRNSMNEIARLLMSPEIKGFKASLVDDAPDLIHFFDKLETVGFIWTLKQTGFEDIVATPDRLKIFGEKILTDPSENQQFYTSHMAEVSMWVTAVKVLAAHVQNLENAGVDNKKEQLMFNQLSHMALTQIKNHLTAMKLFQFEKPLAEELANPSGQVLTANVSASQKFPILPGKLYQELFTWQTSLPSVNENTLALANDVLDSGINMPNPKAKQL